MLLPSSLAKARSIHASEIGERNHQPFHNMYGDAFKYHAIKETTRH